MPGVLPLRAYSERNSARARPREHFRIARKVAADRVISTVDPDARHMQKSRSSYRDGYKAHLAVEPETGLVCAAALTPANAADGPAGVGLQANTVTCPAGHTVAITPEPPDGSRLALWPLATPRALHPRQGRQNPQPASPGSRTGGGPPLRHRPRPSRPATVAGGRWWNARSPGWSQTATAGSATAAWPATSSACQFRVAAINLRRLIAMGLDHTRCRMGADLREVCSGPGVSMRDVSTA